jgi:hypothetical protein
VAGEVEAAGEPPTLRHIQLGAALVGEGADIEDGVLEGHRVQGLAVSDGAELRDGDAVRPRFGQRLDPQPQLIVAANRAKGGGEHQCQDNLRDAIAMVAARISKPIQKSQSTPTKAPQFWSKGKKRRRRHILAAHTLRNARNRIFVHKIPTGSNQRATKGRGVRLPKDPGLGTDRMGGRSRQPHQNQELMRRLTRIKQQQSRIQERREAMKSKKEKPERESHHTRHSIKSREKTYLLASS